MTETYELEKIIQELYKLEEMLGYSDNSVVTNKVHDLAFRLRISKENNYDKLRESLNRWNKAERLLNGEIMEEEPSIEYMMSYLQRRTEEIRKKKEESEKK